MFVSCVNITKLLFICMCIKSDLLYFKIIFFSSEKIFQDKLVVLIMLNTTFGPFSFTEFSS